MTGGPGSESAFARPETVLIAAATAGVLLLATLAISWLSLAGRGTPELRRELWLRLGSWLAILPLTFAAVLAGRVWTIAAVTLLGLACLREYDRATGLFRERAITAIVALGILLANFAALDRWYGFFVALWPLTVSAIAVATIPLDRPEGYIQRTALGILAYMLFGAGLSHLGYMANEPGYRPMLLLLLLAVALNDVAAFTWGKLLGARLFGGRKLLPATSPNKTVAGAIGALLTTTAVVAFGGRLVFAGTPLGEWPWLLMLGALVSVSGQAGDLLLSSIKRDLGIKDMGTILPGHGGVLDRANSLLLMAPACFHLIHYLVGIGLDGPTRLMTGPSVGP